MIDLKLSEEEKKNLTEDEIEIAMARKLEILILPMLRRNIDFFYAGWNLKGKANAYKNPMDKEAFEKTLKENPKENIETVCKPLCDMVSEILNENGIKADTISCDTDIFRHTDVMITTKSGKRYIINYLEDMENVQTGMKTPDFASKPYYKRRYEKFEGGKTTDGKTLGKISFLDEDRLSQIDKNLGYKEYNLYMDDVVERIKTEFDDYREVMAENEWLNREFELKQENQDISTEEIQKQKESIYKKYNEMTDDEVLENKLDWIFDNFNDRMDIKGHTDFVMYYSRLLLKRVLSPEEYEKITRYEGTVKKENIPEDSKIKSVLDNENPDNDIKSRFCLVNFGKTTYAFSTAANTYVKLDKEEFEELNDYAEISKAEKPSDLVLFLCDRGNALPLVFHPFGSKILNERAELIDKELSDEERIKAVQELSSKIKTTDEPITSILIPYPDGTSKYLYINENDELVLKEKNKETIFHYDKETDSVKKEENDLNDLEER